MEEYYWSLAIQVQSICLVLKEQNGGFLSIEECKRYLEKISSKNKGVIKEDIIMAINILSRDLGSSFKILEEVDIICCVPVTMNEDYKEVLSNMPMKFTKDQLMAQLNYNDARADMVIVQMLENCLVCEDSQTPANRKSSKNIEEAPYTPLYWIISLATDENDIEENLTLHKITS